MQAQKNKPQAKPMPEQKPRTYARLRRVQLDEFSKNLKTNVENAVNDKSPFKVVYGKGKYFVVFSADEWESEQETLHVLQDTDLVRRIGEALRVHSDKAKQKPAVGGRRVAT